MANPFVDTIIAADMKAYLDAIDSIRNGAGLIDYSMLAGDAGAAKRQEFLGRMNNSLIAAYGGIMGVPPDVLTGYDDNRRTMVQIAMLPLMGGGRTLTLEELITRLGENFTLPAFNSLLFNPEQGIYRTLLSHLSPETRQAEPENGAAYGAAGAAA